MSDATASSIKRSGEEPAAVPDAKKCIYASLPAFPQTTFFTPFPDACTLKADCILLDHVRFHCSSRNKAGEADVPPQESGADAEDDDGTTRVRFIFVLSSTYVLFYMRSISLFTLTMLPESRLPRVRYSCALPKSHCTFAYDNTLLYSFSSILR